jgi:hypothetical protein
MSWTTGAPRRGDYMVMLLSLTSWGFRQGRCSEYRYGGALFQNTAIAALALVPTTSTIAPFASTRSEVENRTEGTHIQKF